MTAQFDMFADDAPITDRRLDGRSPTAMNEDEMVRHLQETGRYRILTKVQPRPISRYPNPAFPLRGVIIDTETIGLSSRKDEIIEIGVVAFSFDDAGMIGEVTDLYGGLRQPNGPIPAEITRFTGITEAMVAGQAIDFDRLEALVKPADLIIAHNAGFDRPFCEALSPVFADKAWASSVSAVDWRRVALRERSLAI